jgi:hypothetical protein
MNDPAELTAYIRFALSQLRAQNRHHDFEHLCFHLARNIITPDLRPATGPVAAGGDQGRDFESFRGRRNREELSFACTLQADDVPTKIRSDVRDTVAKGLPVDGIYAFCEADLPVRRRQDLEKEVHDEHGLQLQILDGQALATQLADYENFWIAKRYLAIPDNMAPEAPPSSENYAAARERWQRRTEPPSTFGDLVDLNDCARAAVFGNAPSSDTPFWLDLLRSLARPAGDQLARAAFYHLVVLSFRGLETASGLEEEISEYFSVIPSLDGEVELENAEVLLNYVSTASRAHIADVDRVDIERWRQQLLDRIRALLADEPPAGRRCSLLLSLGGAYIILGPEGDVDEDERVDQALEVWLELATNSSSAPLFPIDRLGAILAATAPRFAGRDGYQPLLLVLDPQVLRVSGEKAMAKVHRDRGLALRDSHPLQAIDDLNQARAIWLREDTRRGAVLMGTGVASCYSALELFYAAKLHSVCAAGVSLTDDRNEMVDLAGSVVLSASSFDYRLGRWMGAVELTEIGIMLYDELHRAPWHAEDSGRDETMLHLLVPFGVATLFLPDAEPSIRAALIRTELFGLVTPENSPWTGMTEPEVAADITDADDHSCWVHMESDVREHLRRSAGSRTFHRVRRDHRCAHPGGGHHLAAA